LKKYTTTPKITTTNQQEESTGNIATSILSNKTLDKTLLTIMTNVKYKKKNIKFTKNETNGIEFKTKTD